MKNSDDFIKEYCEDKCFLFSNGCPNDYGDSMTKVPCYALSEIMRKETEYSFEDLKKDLKRLDEKADDLDKLKLESDEIKITAPVYIAKRMELYMKYFGLKFPINNSFPIEDDEKQER